jgi:membrane associated rhomboid family serine protease
VRPAAWQFGPRRTGRGPFRAVATAAAFVLIAVPSLLELKIAPGMLAAMKRSGMSTGLAEPWRIVTALLVQDGGWAGMAFNLTILAWIGIQAESAWGVGRWTLIAMCSGIGVQAWGWLVQPVGAGNSVLAYGLAASLLVGHGPGRTWPP